MNRTEIIEDQRPVEISLHSSPMLHVPGFVKYLQNRYLGDQWSAFQVAGECWPVLRFSELLGLLDGSMETRREGDTIIFQRQPTMAEVTHA